MNTEETASLLKSEAKSIIKGLGLIEILGRYGKARVVGSVALDLIVEREIDIHLLMPSGDLMKTVREIKRELSERNKVVRIRISDLRSMGGTALTIEHYPGKSGEWSIDLWISDRPETTGFYRTEQLKKDLHLMHRKAIMLIKRQFHSNGKLQRGLSDLIYEAVLYRDIRTYEGFRKFMVDTGKTQFIYYS